MVIVKLITANCEMDIGLFQAFSELKKVFTADHFSPLSFIDIKILNRYSERARNFDQDVLRRFFIFDLCCSWNRLKIKFGPKNYCFLGFQNIESIFWGNIYWDRDFLIRYLKRRGNCVFMGYMYITFLHLWTVSNRQT